MSSEITDDELRQLRDEVFEAVPRYVGSPEVTKQRKRVVLRRMLRKVSVSDFSQNGSRVVTMKEMNAATRDKLILDLRAKGWTFKQIGKHVGLSESGVAAAWKRIWEGRPGRPPQ